MPGSKAREVLAKRSGARRLIRLYVIWAGLVTAAFCFISAPASYGAGATAGVLDASTPNKNVVTFGTQTASATKPDGRGIYSFGATPGGQLEDHVAILNYSDQPVTLLIRPVDAVNTPQGGFAAVPINQRSKEVGTWVALPASDLTVSLAARSDVIVPFLVEVPKNATPGDHFGVLTATLESSVISKSGQRIHLLQTVGTRIFIRVSGPLHPGLAVENLHVQYRGTNDPVGTGKAILTYTVVNNGNVALGGSQTVSVTGLFGSKRTAVHVAQIQLLLPGNAVKQTVDITGVIPEIRDSAHVSISPLYIQGTVQPASGPFKATTSFWAIPWTLIAIVIAIILLAIGGLWWRRRRRRGPANGEEPGPVGPSGEARGVKIEESGRTGTASDVTPAGAKPPESEPAPVGRGPNQTPEGSST
jgi:hypothetical protein